MKKIFAASLILLTLLISACSHKGILLIKEGKSPLEVKHDFSILPEGVTDFTLNPGDVLRLEASCHTTGEKQFLLERDYRVHITFHYTKGHYHLMPGDLINVDFLADADLAYDLTVRMDGRISMPKVGEIQAAGKSPSDLGEKITQKFEGKINDPRVSVSVLRSNLEPIQSMAGEYTILPDGTIHLPVLGTFAAAGKTLDELEAALSLAVQKKLKNKFNASVVTSNFVSRHLEAYERVVTVTPSGEIILPEIGSIEVKGLTMAEMKSRVQDALEKKYSNSVDVTLTLISGGNHSVYVSGNVKFPGVYPLAPSMTMLKAVMLAGGATRTGDIREAVLVHYSAGGDLNIFITNLNEVMEKGIKIQDLKLSPQDIVFVPRSGIAEANRFIEQYITGMLPFSRGVNYNYNKNPDLNQ